MTDAQYDSEIHLLASQGEWDSLTQNILLQLKSSDEDCGLSLEEQLLSREGPNKWTPLMLSCARAPPGVIALLLECCPDSCTAVDRSGSLPLHLICSCARCDNEADSDYRKVVLMLLQESPEGLSKKNQWNQTPLHCIFDNKEVPCMDTLRILLGMWSSHGENDSLYDNVALANVQERKTAEETVQFHARAALASLDSKSYLPLHYASSKGASEDILRLLSTLYSDAATISTTKGDLPIHLLHRWAEDQAESDSDETCSSIDQPMNTIFQNVTLGQVEALLEPLCLSLSKPRDTTFKFQSCGDIDGTMITISEHDEETENDTSTGAASSSLQATTTATPASNSAITAIACRSPGAGDGLKLPLHIAAEHGVSYEILCSLCEQFPSAASIPSSIPSVPQKSNGSLDSENTCSNVFTEIYAIELFECGRAFEALNDISCLGSDRQSVNRSSHRSIEDSKIQLALESFHERSDLIFAYDPSAKVSKSSVLPSMSESGESYLIPCKRLISKEALTPYCRQPDRLNRIQCMIRKEACDNTSTSLNTKAKLLWTWLLDCLQDSSFSTLRGFYQQYYGRIITNLPTSSLLKLNYNTRTNDSDLTNAPFSLNGKTIEKEAEDRSPCATFEELIKCDGGRNWQYILLSFLDNIDGSNYSATCRGACDGGLRYLPEYKLLEAGRTWNLPSYKEKDPMKPELWQYLDHNFVCQECTHTIHVSFYLEVSEVRGREGESSSSKTQIDEDAFSAREKGGLVVMSEKKSLRQVYSEEESCDQTTISERTSVHGGTIETDDQKKLKFSNIATQSGCEVTLSFRYTPNRFYSLWVVGPPLGGRVSISNTRIQQLVHVLDKNRRSPLHLLLHERNIPLSPPLRTQLMMLLNTNVGSNLSSIPLHYALKCGASVEILKEIVHIDNSCLLEVDEHGRTPLHSVFLLSKDEAPSLAVIKTLLSGVGENATKLKDINGDIPIHLAAERGVDESVLGLLVACHADGCYRTNRNGDLPLHLLARSGFANTNSVEILLMPIIQNETICRIPGSGDEGLPLHVACSFTCSFQVLERLLLTYGEAALIPKKSDANYAPLYPLDLFEQNRTKFEANQSCKEQEICADSQKAKDVVAKADFDLRSDLLFAYNPLLTPANGMETTPAVYRKDINRLDRLQKVVRREAIECTRSGNSISQLARYSWCFFCNFQNPDDPNDNYTQIVSNIMRGMPTSAVKVLADVTNPFSIPNEPITDCATVACKELILQRIRFLGRYLFYDDESLIHKSDSCLVLGAIDYGAVESYKHILSLFLIPETPDIDDLRTIDSGTTSCVLSSDEYTLDNIHIIQSVFVEFASKLGFSVEVATKQFQHIFIPIVEDEEIIEFHEDPRIMKKVCKKERMMRSFFDLCKSLGIKDGGTRNVVMKFTTHRSRFMRERLMRRNLDMDVGWQVFPILEDYDIDRISKDPPNERSNLECKDILFATQIQDKNLPFYDLSMYKYCIVLPRGDKNFEDIVRHEDINILKKREYMLQVGDALKMLHSKNLIHGSLKMSNIVRFSPSRIALIDLSNASPVQRHIVQSIGDSNEMVDHTRRDYTSLMPPEMITRINLSQDRHLLRRYEAEWKQVSNDALDLSLFTPDDVIRITTTITTMLSSSTASRNIVPGKTDFLRNSIDTSEVGSKDGDYDTLWKSQIAKVFGNVFQELPLCLSRCNTIREFALTWDRLNTSSQTWQIRRPRFSSDGKYAYIFKSMNEYSQLPFTQNNTIPKTANTASFETNKSVDGSISTGLKSYDVTYPSVKTDIWDFGLILFSLCSGVTLFRTDKEGQLVDDESYECLYNWDTYYAKRLFSSSIDDPLAIDLLMKLLVPENERLSSMEAVLQNPFFGSTIGVEARKIYERSKTNLIIQSSHPQKSRGNTFTESKDEHECELFEGATESKQVEASPKISRQNTSFKSQSKSIKTTLLSMEKQCKIIFERIKDIKIPTSFIILPFTLSWNLSEQRFMAPIGYDTLLLGQSIGKSFLEINLATAKLSFWLKMKDLLSQPAGKVFKDKVRSWIHRARFESSHDIAREIITSIGFGDEYQGVCVEMLDENMGKSYAQKFIQDPAEAAKDLIESAVSSLLKCYQHQYFYLVDECSGLPYASRNDDKAEKSVYPIDMSAGSSMMLTQTFLPFINMTVMTTLARHGMLGLVRLLGLPASFGVPDEWNDVQLGFSHKAKITPYSSVVEFGILQGILRKKEMSSTEMNKSQETQKPSNADNVSSDFATEIDKLELFFEQHDPVGSFADLNRMCTESDKSLTVWTKCTVSEKLMQLPIESESTFTFEQLGGIQRQIEIKRKLECEAKRTLESLKEKSLIRKKKKKVSTLTSGNKAISKVQYNATETSNKHFSDSAVENSHS